jgi:hypothetical protein
MLPGMERSMLAGLQQRHLVTSLPHLTPNLYEMAALTQELDTMVSSLIYQFIAFCFLSIRPNLKSRFHIIFVFDKKVTIF